MSTVGHFITMIGVLAFYTTLFEAHLEKKLTYYLFSLVPRLNKRVCYYMLKLIQIQLQIKSLSLTPNKQTRTHIITSLAR